MKFISLFAGIGGFDLALEGLGHECVYANEWDKYAASIYDKHFAIKCDQRDIRSVTTEEIPDHQLLVGGFPCQAFSIAGKRRGFADTRGTMFFEVARILKDKRPDFLLLENVKGLLSHDEGNTLQVILTTLDELGYDLQWQVLNSKNFGVPQNRERVFIIGHLRGTSRPQVFPITDHNPTSLRELTQNQSQGNRIYDPDGISTTLASQAGGLGAKTGLYAVRKNRNKIEPTKDESLCLSASYWKGLDNHGARTGIAVPMRWVRTEEGKQIRRESQKEGRDYTPFNGSARRLEPSDKQVIGTITSQAISKDSLLGEETRIRRLTPTECERLQGFPDGWTEGISDTQRYKCLGNAVTVNVVQFIVSRLCLN